MKNSARVDPPIPPPHSLRQGRVNERDFCSSLLLKIEADICQANSLMKASSFILSRLKIKMSSSPCSYYIHTFIKK